MTATVNRTCSVLIADDDPSLRPLLRLLLESDERFEVVGEAADGFTALELIEAIDPDLVLLDLGMPRLDGLQVLERLQQGSRPVVAVLSGFVNERLAGQLREVGATCIQKDEPFRELPDRLAGLVEDVAGDEDAAFERVVTTWLRPQEWRSHLLGGDPYWVEEEVLVLVDGELVHELSWDRVLTVEERRAHDEALLLWWRLHGTGR